VTHSTGQAIGTGTGKHLVGTQHMKGMSSDFNVIGILSNGGGQMLVNGNTASLECFAGDLLLFIANQVSDKGKEIDGSLFGANVKDANLTVGNTTAVPTLNVGLILLVTVATSWTATHDFLLNKRKQKRIVSEGNTTTRNAASHFLISVSPRSLATICESRTNDHSKHYATIE
jgi:hypothetical protein